jgi:GWxTD domain-containing protein
MRILLLAVLSLVAVPALEAQMNLDQSEPRNPNMPITYQAVSLFRPDSAMYRVDIHYRIGQSFFIFVRNESSVSKVEYTARGELVVELLNDQRVSVAREIRQLPLTRNTLPRETDRPPSVQGVVTLTASPGAYTVVFSVDDRESGRTFMERNKKLTLPVPSLKSLDISEMLFVQKPFAEKASSMFVPTNRGGNTLYGEPGCVLTEVHLPSPADSLEVRWKLVGKPDAFGQRPVNLEGSAFVALPGLLDILPQDHGVLYGMKAALDNWKTLVIPLPLEKLEPGRFTLDVQYRSGSAKKQQVQQFDVVWPSRPLSLADPDLAVDALRHIAAEEQIDEMQSGSLEHRSEAFHRFWRSKAPDTLTAYNVAMAEYYYRVDEAMRKFSTARDNDGYKTDRGRIYILCGPPQKSERMLQPSSSPMEIWTYDRLQKRFIFIDTARNGNYILSQAENL